MSLQSAKWLLGSGIWSSSCCNPCQRLEQTRSSSVQVPHDLTTLLRVVQLPKDDEAVATVLFNYLLDSESAERKILVQVWQIPWT